MADKFEDLRNYAAVVENGGVNAAAAALGIAKSAVSRRLGELEARLGVSLIERSTRRFELTALGRDYYTKATAILASLDALDANVADRSTLVKVRVVCSTPLFAHLIAPAIASFLITQQAVSIELAAATDATPQLGTDAVLIIAEGGAGELNSRILTSTRHVVCASQAYLDAHGTPASVADLRDHQGVVVADDPVGWTFAGGPARTPAVRLQVPDVESAMAAAIGGMGLAHLPDFLAARAIERGELQAILGDAPAVGGLVQAMHRGDCDVSVSRLVDHLALSLRRPG